MKNYFKVTPASYVIFKKNNEVLLLIRSKLAIMMGITAYQPVILRVTKPQEMSLFVK
jgi:hypothetical protein